jgi:hypothetical protein
MVHRRAKGEALINTISFAFPRVRDGRREESKMILHQELGLVILIIKENKVFFSIAILILCFRVFL